jgi:hypothetical protein
VQIELLGRMQLQAKLEGDKLVCTVPPTRFFFFNAQFFVVYRKGDKLVCMTSFLNMGLVYVVYMEHIYLIYMFYVTYIYIYTCSM